MYHEETGTTTATMDLPSIPPARGPFGGSQLVGAEDSDWNRRDEMAGLDAILARPSANADLPQQAFAFDPAIGDCRLVNWTDVRESLSIRRTALAIAQAHAALNKCSEPINPQ